MIISVSSLKHMILENVCMDVCLCVCVCVCVCLCIWRPSGNKFCAKMC